MVNLHAASKPPLQPNAAPSLKVKTLNFKQLPTKNEEESKNAPSDTLRSQYADADLALITSARLLEIE